ncbi:MAG: hypothetical protein ACREIO_03020 [Nitrospiraceae bacterium]
MKPSAVKSGKSATIRKRNRPSTRQTAGMEAKITKSFANQVAAFVKRYHPALEALAKR